MCSLVRRLTNCSSDSERAIMKHRVIGRRSKPKPLRTVSAGMQRVPRVPLGMRISLGSNLLKVPVFEIGHKLMPHSIPHARLLSFRWE
jgi:hypothetical protein